jgi:methylated-DNA-[protein]-cysteine S-methyltransferase
MNYWTNYQSPVGQIRLESDEEGLVGLWLESHKDHHGGDEKDWKEWDGKGGVLAEAKQWLGSYFGGGRPEIRELRLRPVGGTFRREVWDILCEIPYGETVTYGQIAKRMAAARGLEVMSARAVGGAVGHNPISIIIPCHRVIGSNNYLTGYGGGIEMKFRLLEHEGVKVSCLRRPALRGPATR